MIGAEGFLENVQGAFDEQQGLLKGALAPQGGLLRVDLAHNENEVVVRNVIKEKYSSNATRWFTSPGYALNPRSVFEFFIFRLGLNDLSEPNATLYIRLTSNSPVFKRSALTTNPLHSTTTSCAK